MIDQHGPNQKVDQSVNHLCSIRASTSPPHTLMDPPHLDRGFVRLQQLPLLCDLGLVGEDARRVVRDDQLPGDSLKLEDCSAVMR